MGATQRFPLGSAKWLADTFADAPAREVQGRSRPTQRFLTFDHRGQILVAEGGGASIARSLIETMRNSGLVSRFKLEPFTLTLRDHGVDATPDLLFQTSDEANFVVEVKSSRFLTPAKLQKCREVEAALRGSGLRYLLWTDSWPLSPSVWRLMREMRRLGYSDLSRVQLTEVSDAIAAGPQTIADLRERGIFRDCIIAAAWHGLAHFDFLRKFDEQTTIGSDVSKRGFSRLLTSSVKAQTWWGSLPNPATVEKRATSSDNAVRREARHA